MFASGLKDANSYFELPYFTKVFNETFKKYEPFDNKDIFLILGETGVGKSVFANYMAGCGFELNKQNGMLRAYPRKGDKEFSKIGHHADSETSYPESVPTHRDFYFADCPAFNSNCSIEGKVAGTVLSQLAIQQATSIKGIVFLLQSGDLDYRTTYFYRGFAALQQSIKNFSQYQNSILFLFCKNDARLEPKHILCRLGELAKAEEKYKAKHKNASELLNILSSSPNQLQLFDPFEATSRENIYSAIQEFKPIPKSQFVFPRYDKDHFAFEKIIFERANMMVNLFKKRRQLKKDLPLLSENQKELLKIETELNENYNNSSKGMAHLSILCKIANFDSDVIQQFIHYYDQYSIEKYLKNSSENQSSCRLM